MLLAYFLQMDVKLVSFSQVPSWPLKSTETVLCTFADYVKRIRFVRSRLCDCMFIRREKNRLVFLISYVDDSLEIRIQHDVNKVKAIFAKLFDVQGLDENLHIQDMRIYRRPNSKMINQNTYR